jgi:ParB family chromosome partitioning protein
MSDFRMIQRDHLVPPSEPMRVAMQDDAMHDLVQSITELGLLQVLLVAPAGDKWEIIDGHRRFVASEKIGVEFLPCRVFDNPDAARHAMMLDATMCHEDFTPAEEGQQFVELSQKYGWTLDQLCEKFRKSESYINSRVVLVTQDQRIADAVNARKINMAQAHELLHEKDPERRGTRLLLCLEHGYNARELRAMRLNLEGERVTTETGVTPHTPEFAAPPPPGEPVTCEWCGGGEDPENLRQLWVHWYHMRELRAVCNQVGARNLLGVSPAVPAKE